MNDIYDELDSMIDCEQCLDDVLNDNGLDYDTALQNARNSLKHYKSTAVGYKTSIRSMLWQKLISDCRDELTEQKLDLLLWLIVGGEFSACDNDALILKWIHTTKAMTSLRQKILTRKEKYNEFRQICNKATSAKQLMKDSDSVEYEKIFAMLCSEGYAEDCRDKSILYDNLRCIEEIIAAAHFLKPVSPLVYYQIIVHNRKKLFEKADYVPTVKNLFRYECYNIEQDNGKNFDQYAIYCSLYSDLKTCVPAADIDLCDAGFMKCSNLSQWCYRHVEGADTVPRVIEDIVDSYNVLLSDNIKEENPFWRNRNITIEKVWLWQEKYPVFDRAAAKAVKTVRFNDFVDFFNDCEYYCDRLFHRSGYVDKVKPQVFDQAQALLMHTLECRFEDLLSLEISRILDNFIEE